MTPLDLPPDPSRLAFLDYMKPKPETPAYWPLANAIRRGTSDEFPRVPEDTALLIGRIQDCHVGLRPSDPFHVWAVDQIALTTVRLDRCGRIERRLRDQAVIRVELDWDDDRAELARAIGAGLAGDPRGAGSKLRSTPHGCDWMIARWSRLALAVQDRGAWTAAEVGQAHDLLGTPIDERHEAPGFHVTHDGKRAQAHHVEPAELARREVASLGKRRAKAVHQDALARAMMEADLVLEPTPELRQLGRHEASLRGWLRWLVKQVRTEAPDRDTPSDCFPTLPDVQPSAKPEPETSAAPEPTPPVESPKLAEPPAEADAEPGPFGCRPPLPRIAARTRKDPKAVRDEARRSDRQRKRQARRA